MRIRVVVTGRSYDNAAHLPSEIDLPDGAAVQDAIRHLESQLPDGATFPASCIVAVSGNHLGTLARLPSRMLCDNDELMLIAPVAGG